MPKTTARTLPRPFDDGSLSVRFCYYDHAGRFQRSPLIVSKDEVAGLKKALWLARPGCERSCGRW